MSTRKIENMGNIVAIEIDELFGRYSYSLHSPSVADSEQRRLMLLYGDNGVGKTTVLRLVWNLLSPAHSKGHRSYLAQTPFRRLAVNFSGGLTVEVQKVRDLKGSIVIEVRNSARRKPIVQTLYEADSDHSVRPELIYDLLIEPKDARDRHANTRERSHRNDSYRDFLIESGVSGPLLLADDRVLHSDLLADSEAREEITEYSRRIALIERSGAEHAAATVTLERTIRNAADALRALAFGGQRSGAAGGQDVYFDVLRQLGRPRRTRSDGLESFDEIVRRISELSERNERYAEFDLVPSFDSKSFLVALRKIPKLRRETAISIVEPFVESLDSRLSALEDAEKVIREFLRQANKFLRDKQVYFRMREGITVRTSSRSEPLRASSLSSGERHLMLLLCSTLIAREHFTLFIIDEPELSLNVVWQRTVMQSLLRLTEGTNVQFIAATHSIEMISRNRPSLIPLGDREAR